MADSAPPEQGTSQQPLTPTQILSNAISDPSTFLKKAEDLITRGIAEQEREVLRDIDQLQAISLEVAPQFSGSTGDMIRSIATKLAPAIGNGRKIASDNPPHANQQEGGDPIDLALGQLVYRHTDLDIDGAGISFQLIRTYRSGASYPNSPLGTAWDHSFNLWLRVDPTQNVVVVNSGELREDRYELVEPTIGQSYYALQEGYHAVLTVDALGVYRLRRPDGLTYEYEQEQGLGSPTTYIFHRIKRIYDRFPQRNELTFTYTTDADGILTVQVFINDITRVVTLAHDDLGRLQTITDYSGRRVTYTYDDYDDLVAVTLPPTANQQLGRTTFYTYSSDTGPTAHKMLSINDADGRCYLDVEYGIEEGSMDFDRVVRQRDDEGEWLISYMMVDISDGLPADVSNRYTLMIHPNGHEVEHWFNRSGNLLFKRERFFDEDGGLQIGVWKFLYNPDGQLIASISPSGAFTQALFARDQFMLNSPGLTVQSALTELPVAPTIEQRQTFSNRLASIRRSSTASRLWPPAIVNLNDITQAYSEDIVQIFTYETNFQLIASSSDPRSTTDIKNANSAGMTTYKYTAGSLSSVNYPPTTNPVGAMATASEIYQHDLHGRLTLTTDPEGHVTKRVYFPPGSVVGVEAGFPIASDPTPPPPTVSIEGYLQSTTSGAGESSEATTTFEVNRRGIPTKVTDPRGASVIKVVDATGQPLAEERELDSGVVYTTTYRYTPQRRICRTERPVKDDQGNPLGDGVEVRYSRYSARELLLRESIGAADPMQWLTTRHCYNADGLPTRSISSGNSVTHLRYDRRRLIVAKTRGFGTPEALTERVLYDLNSLS